MRPLYIGLVLIVMVAVILAPQIARIAADSIDVQAGNIYYASLEGLSDTLHWAGLKIVHDSTSLSESNLPFATITIDTPIIAQVPFPGENFKNNVHWYGAMLPSEFLVTQIEEIEISDLASNQLFASSTFPSFYPNYDNRNDNPFETFCCDTEQVQIGGQNFTAFKIDIEQGIDYYLLKYNDGGTMTPLFLVKNEDAFCYNATSCVGEFMLPITSQPYNFYAISELPAYTYTTFIDGVPSDTFPQTGLPYNLTVEVRELYSGALAPGVSVTVGEENGQNLFVPYRFQGYVSNFYTVGITNSMGRETFLVAPTEYADVQDYSMYVAVLYQDTLSSIEPLSVGNTDSLVQQSKPLNPAMLYDDAKATVNTLNSINNFLFIWSSQLLQAYRYTVQYDIATTDWTVSPAHTSGNTFELKTGAPNVVNVIVTNNGFPQSGYTARIRERDGHLIMNPYTGSAPLTGKDRVSSSQNLPTGTEFIVTPTSIGAVESNITLEIMSGDAVIASLPAQIDSDLNIGSSGVFYNNDLLKTVTNTMNQIVNSLFYALNN